MYARRCGTEGRTGHQGRNGGIGDGNRGGGGDGNENKDGNGPRTEMGARTGAGTGRRTKRGVKWRQSLEVYEVVVEVDRKT